MRVLNPCELRFDTTNFLSSYPSVNCFSLTSHFSAPLVNPTPFPPCILLCFTPFQSYSIYYIISNRSKILISVSIKFFADKRMDFLWLIISCLHYTENLNRCVLQVPSVSLPQLFMQSDSEFSQKKHTAALCSPSRQHYPPFKDILMLYSLLEPVHTWKHNTMRRSGVAHTLSWSIYLSKSIRVQELILHQSSENQTLLK